jgi:tRNA(adenine34) deaminase
MENLLSDLKFMQAAYSEAIKAYENGEVPVGCVITRGREILSRAANARAARKNALCHAEILAIHKACEAIGDWRLEGCRLYVTVEPCPMCAGAIIQARIPAVVYGTANKKAGCAGSILNILNEPRFNHRAEVIAGVMEMECAALMSDFFTRFRGINI